MTRINWKKVLGITTAAISTAFAAASIVAKKKRPDSVYDNAPEQKNPLEGKKVVFVEDGDDKENADGAKGHLESIGEAEHYPSFYEKYIKRICDVVLSFGGLVVLSPVMAAISIAIKVEDPGSVLFVQKRIGKNKQYFKLHKFRSMKMCTPHDVPTHMLDNPDQYITKVGKFIRAHSLDELPQIWDIFVGNMSVIGPRPGLWNQDILISERDKYGANEVKPGLTGWAQINGRDAIEIPVKAKLDGEYVEKLSPSMDVKCFLGSMHVFNGDDSVVEGGTGALTQNDWSNLEIDPSIKVSIITPVYNAEKYLLETIESIQNQTFTNWEMIIVDDCSSDGTFELASKYAVADERIKVIRRNYNLGVASARNAGLDAATGKYIAFLDSDDLWLPQKLEKQVKFMEANKYTLTYTLYQKFNSETGGKGRIIRAPDKMTAKKIYGDTSIGCLTVMVNRELSGEFHMPIRNHTEDNITWQNILSRGGCSGYLLDEVLAMYREGNNSLTNSKSKAAKQQWRTYREFYEFSIPKSMFYFSQYSINAVKKHFM